MHSNQKYFEYRVKLQTSVAIIWEEGNVNENRRKTMCYGSRMK